MAVKVAPTGPVDIPSSLTIKDLADRLHVGPNVVLKELMKSGIIANINLTIDYDTAAVVATDLGFEPREIKPVVNETAPAPVVPPAPPAELKPRAPVVTVMGHVDHGKTSLLDAIRKTNVAAQEAGAITQHIGAYQVEVRGQKITFLDTPGHEAFTAMRARGAKATDIAILVVAADDGVMPQTIEAMNHAKAANVPIVVALNKIDRANANPERVKTQLAEAGLQPEDWGGDTIVVPVSARNKVGIESLLEMVLLVAEVAELKSRHSGPAKGVVVEAQMDKARGPLATVLVQEGTLKIGDNAVVGAVSGKVRAMFNDRGRPLKRAEPSAPAAILGLTDVPKAGDILEVVADERTAKAIATERQLQQERAAAAPARALTLEDLQEQIQAGEVKDLNIILKTDVQGSIEPIRVSVERLSNENLKVNVIHVGTGNVNESDVLLAQASNGIIVGFNVRIEPGAKRMSEGAKTDIRLYNVIYTLVQDIEQALAGMLEPKYVEVLQGRAEVIAVFPVRKGNAVAGTRVVDGRVTRGARARVLRAGKVVYDGRMASLRRFKDDVNEVAAGYECGIQLEDLRDPLVGDVIETYDKERAK